MHKHTWTNIWCQSVFQVVEQGMFVKHCKVEVYLTELKLCENGNMNNVVTRGFSKADTIGMHQHSQQCMIVTCLNCI